MNARAIIAAHNAEIARLEQWPQLLESYQDEIAEEYQRACRAINQEEITMTMADYLRKQITISNMSHQHLANLSSVSQPTISRFVKNPDVGLTLESAEKLLVALGVEFRFSHGAIS